MDCTQISDLCQVNNISEYPTRRPYVRGEFHSNYKLDRTVIAFTHYLNIIEEDVDKKKYDELQHLGAATTKDNAVFRDSVPVGGAITVLLVLPGPFEFHLAPQFLLHALVGQTRHLKAAAIGDKWPAAGSFGKTVRTTGVANVFDTRFQQKVVRVAKH